jgi:hypothetical protein
MTVLLSTTSERAAAGLAGDVNVLAIHQLADPEAAGQLAAGTGAGAAGGGPGPAAQPDTAVPQTTPAAPGGAVPQAPSAAPGGAVPQATPAVPDWARRMPAPAAAGSSAGAATAAAVPGPAAEHPFGRKGSPVVTADSLLGLRGGAFTLVVKGPERRIRPRCQPVPARVPGRPA